MSFKEPEPKVIQQLSKLAYRAANYLTCNKRGITISTFLLHAFTLRSLAEPAKPRHIIEHHLRNSPDLIGPHKDSECNQA